MKTGLFEKIPNHVYHSEEYDYLSSTEIRNLLITPAHYKARKNEGERNTPALNFGSATHSMILQPELEEVAALPKIDKRTKAGKAEFAEFCDENEGKIIVSEKEYLTIQAMQKVLYKHKYAKRILDRKSIKKEVSAVWREDSGDDSFLCKLRADILSQATDNEFIVDYKTTGDASHYGFSRQIFNKGYHIQAYHYARGMKALTGKDHIFMFIAQEKEAPYAVNVFSVDEEVMEIAKDSWEKATSDYLESLKSGRWSAYKEGVWPINVPNWL